MTRRQLFRRHARLFSFVAVLLLSSSLVMLLFQGARAVDMEFTTAPTSIAATETFQFTIRIPQGERIPIARIDAVVESERVSGTGKLNPVVQVRASCLMAVPMDCSGSSITTVQGTSGIVTQIRLLSITNAAGTTIPDGYTAACTGGSPCTGDTPGYGYDTISPDVARGGYGYGYRVGRSTFGPFTSGEIGYGYSVSDMVMTFQVTINAASLPTGSNWLTMTARTGSSITGEISTPFTAFTVSRPTGGGGGGGGAGGIFVTATIVGNTATATITGAVGQAVTITLGTINGFQFGTLTFTLSQAVTNAVVTVTVSSTPTEGAIALPSSFGPVIYLSINVPAGVASGGGALTFTLTSAQLAGNAPATVTMLHFANNVWQAQPTTVVSTGADGSASFSATLGSFSPFAIAFDTAAPTITNLRPPEGAGATTRPLIAASLVDNRGINTAATRMFVDNQLVQATVTANEILYTPPVALTLGTHSVRVEVTDLSGFTANRTWSFNAAAAADDQPPTVNPVSPPRDGFTNNNRPTIEASFADNLGVDTTRVTATLDGAPAVAPTITATSVRFTPAVGLTDGRHTVTVTVADTSGNSNFATWGFTVDTALPIISAVEPEEGATVGARPTLRVTCSDALAGIDTSKTRILLDGVAVGSGGTYTPTSDLKEGRHTATAECTDMAGNTATRTWSFNTTPGAGVFPTMLVLLLIVLVVVAGAGYWWYTNKGPGRKP